MADPCAIDFTKLSKKIWLVKVPNAVAQVWKPLCEQAMTSQNLEDDDDTQLGTVTVETVVDAEGRSRPEVKLHVSSNPGSKAAPGTGSAGAAGAQGAKSYKLSQLSMGQAGSGLVAAVSYKPGAAQGEDPSAIRVEGTVDASFNATPILQEDNKGLLVVDADYRRMSKERNIKAATKLRSVQLHEDSRSSHLQLLAAKRAEELNARRTGEEVRRAAKEHRRVAAAADALEDVLFALFCRQSQWSFPALQKETKQPAPHLKSVLDKIAILNKRGPHRDLYELKKDYQLPSAAAAAAAAAEQQQAAAGLGQ